MKTSEFNQLVRAVAAEVLTRAGIPAGVEAPTRSYGKGGKKGRKAVAKTTKKASKRSAAKKATPQWLIERGKNSAARRKLAAELRAQDLPTSGPAWEAAKQAAGIK